MFAEGFVKIAAGEDYGTRFLYGNPVAILKKKRHNRKGADRAVEHGLDQQQKGAFLGSLAGLAAGAGRHKLRHGKTTPRGLMRASLTGALAGAGLGMAAGGVKGHLDAKATQIYKKETAKKKLSKTAENSKKDALPGEKRVKSLIKTILAGGAAGAGLGLAERAYAKKVIQRMARGTGGVGVGPITGQFYIKRHGYARLPTKRSVMRYGALTGAAGAGLGSMVAGGAKRMLFDKKTDRKK